MDQEYLLNKIKHLEFQMGRIDRRNKELREEAGEFIAQISNLKTVIHKQYESLERTKESCTGMQKALKTAREELTRKSQECDEWKSAARASLEDDNFSPLVVFMQTKGIPLL